MVKFTQRLINTLLVLTGLAAAVGLAYTLKPDFFNFVFQSIGLNEGQIGSATTILAGLTVFGSLSKYLKGIVNTQQVLHETETKKKIKLTE